jgi:hypothetical protein
MNRAPLLAALLALAGCQTVVEAPQGEVDRRAVYQTIADALPRGSFGWGDPPGIVGIAASVKREQPWPEPQRLKATERGFRLHYQVYRPRDVWVPYETIEQVSYRWLPFPNAALIPLVIVPLQALRTEVVIDTGRIPGLFDQLLADVDRLELLSKEVGMGSPWSHAQDIKAAMNASAAEHGVGRLTVEFDFITTMVPWIPVGGPAEEAAQAFAWAAAHPDEPELPE